MMKSALRLALYRPDMPQNFGNLLRLAACLGVGVDAIEPFGFPFDDRRARRAGMDYLDQVALTRHADWESFLATKPPRLVLLSTHAATPYLDFAFHTNDVLMVGQESAGVPASVTAACQAAIAIPMAPGTRCLNVTSAAAMVLGEALRQTR